MPALPLPHTTQHSTSNMCLWMGEGEKPGRGAALTPCTCWIWTEDTNFQFGEDSKDAIQTLYASEVKKRSKEIEELCKLLDMDKDKLSAPMDKSIFTSYVLPVLHTSILMQEGTPHMVIAKNADFLKYTGIDNMINHLDNIIAAKQSEYILKIEQNLKKLDRKPEMVSNTKGVESALNLLKRKELKDLVEGSCCLTYDLMLAGLQRQLKTLYKYTLATTVDSLLASSVQDAKARWEEKENRITSQGQFNPYFCGNHPVYQVRIAQVLFLDSEDHTNKIFKFLAAEIKRLLLQYKKNVFEVFSKQLNNLCSTNELQDVDLSTVVKEAIKDPLNEALNWYIGKQKMPFNKPMIVKYFNESKKLSLKKYLLTPSYKIGDIDETKHKAKQNIEKTIMNVSGYFIDSILLLHEIRWKSFTSHLQTKKGVPKLWLVLIGRLKEMAKRAGASAQTPKSSKVEAMISAKLRK